MKNISFLICMFVCACVSKAQLPFKYDNTSYKAIYLNQVTKLMAENPGYLLLDVRSPGEYADTSQSTFLNMGHLRGARNIDIDSVSHYLDELKKNRDRAIFIYCSHSQRSRRVSKLLSENGFKNIYNINGGMSVVNESDDYVFPDKNKIYATANGYKNISSNRACELITKERDLLIIDLRSKKQFESADSVSQHNIGRIRNSINIPENEFADKFRAMHIPKEKKILLYDLYGYNSVDYALQLVKEGYKEVYNLFEGIANLETDNNANLNLVDQLITDKPPFKIIGVKNAITLMQEHPWLVILDARSENEFLNKADHDHMNLGRIKNAQHVDDRKLDDVIGKLTSLDAHKKNEPCFLVYGSGQNTDDRSAAICMKLVEKGYKSIYLLYPGLYRFVWSTANIESCKGGRALLTNHDGLY